MSLNTYILDKDNNPVLCNEVAAVAWKWSQDNPHKKRVSITRFPDGTSVSTVFLTLDHSFGFGENTKPILWETMVFGSDLNYDWSEYQERYSSYDEAVAGHLRIVKALLNGEKSPTLIE